MNCPNCGTDIADGIQFCGNCGTPTPSTPAAPPVPPVPPPVPPQVPPVPPVQVPPVIGGGDPTMVGAYPPGPPITPPGAPGAFAAPPPGGPMPVAAMAPPPAKKKSKKSLLLALLALLVVAGAVGGFLVLSGDDDDAAGGQIILEPIGQTITDDFAGDLDVEVFGSSIANVLPGLPPLGSGIGSALSALEADGDTPGLYGGTRDAATCDVEELVAFLTDEDNADKAEAWADVIGIDVDEIEDFIAGLTPVRLRFDTRVTNHGFTDGEANGFQSILEAGTAVLVDDEGVPRVKCNCGNPLDEPEDVGDLNDDDALDVDALAANPDDAWDEFDPELVVVVIAADDPIDEFTLVDIETGELFGRPVGTDGAADKEPADVGAACELLGDSPSCGAVPPDDTTTTTPDDTTTTVVLGTGDVQVTLEWFSNADLDLAVTDPNGERLSFGNRGPTSTGGQLDIDSNVGCPTGVSSGVENVFWPPGGAPAGTYTVEVNGFAVDSGDCGGGDYRLTIRVAGAGDQVIEDTVADFETDTHTFVVG